jgi:hypothetical protein
MSDDYKDYSTVATCIWPTEPLFTKRDWIPSWFWRLVSKPDVVSHVTVNLKKSADKIFQQMLENTFLSQPHLICACGQMAQHQKGPKCEAVQ